MDFLMIREKIVLIYFDYIVINYGCCMYVTYCLMIIIYLELSRF